MSWVLVTSTSYLTESSPPHAARMVALAGLLRNIGAAIAAAIIHPLIQAMGYGWCYTGLAFLVLACVAGVLYMRKTGSKYRAGLQERMKNATAAKKKEEKSAAGTKHGCPDCRCGAPVHNCPNCRCGTQPQPQPKVTV